MAVWGTGQYVDDCWKDVLMLLFSFTKVPPQIWEDMLYGQGGSSLKSDCRTGCGIWDHALTIFVHYLLIHGIHDNA